MSDPLTLFFQAHPWHGIVPGPDAPSVVNAYIEIVPTDAVKYELDKTTGHLRVDRPQRFSSQCPTPYGFIPQTFCGNAVAALSQARTGRDGIRGDGDPLDICVLTERPAAHGGFIVRAVPIGGLRMIDSDEADDKIIAVLESDVSYGHLRDIADAPAGLVDRLQHYFLTYKHPPQGGRSRVEIVDVYDRDGASDVVRRSIGDYRATFGTPETRVAALRQFLSGQK